MGPGVDKLFLEINGRPLVAYTWERFDRCPDIDELIVVVRDGMEPEFQKIAESVRPTRPFRFVQGGAERQNSVWNGLQALSEECTLVAIQDGARPCTSVETIRETIAAARLHGAAVAAQKITDTIKEADDSGLIARNVDRSKLWAVQTPQVFQVAVIRRALNAVIEQGRVVTDDTAACELIGQKVKLVETKAPNPKATSPADLPFIETLLGDFGKHGEEPNSGRA